MLISPIQIPNLGVPMKLNLSILCHNNTLVFSIQGVGEVDASMDKNIADDRGNLRPKHTK